MVKNDEGKYVADEYLNATQNDNWNGFRSNLYPATLTLEEMHKIAAEQPSHVRTKVVLFKVSVCVCVCVCVYECVCECAYACLREHA
jgi:hypothetical protein